MTVVYIILILISIHVIPEVLNAWKVAKHEPVNNSPEINGFSIIVAARNEARNLEKLIPLLLDQDYPEYEIIICLDRCTDDSNDVIQQYPSCKIKPILISDLPENTDGKKFALTQGIHKARFEWVLLTDADCRPASDQWIRIFNSHIEPQIDILLGVSPYYVEPGVLNAFIQYETFQTALQYSSAAIKKKPYMGVGRNLAYRKSLFTSSGGFAGNIHITGGDDDLFVQKNATKINTRMVFSHKSLTYSHAKRSIKEYITQKHRHLAVGQHYRSKLKATHLQRHFMIFIVWTSFLYLVFVSPINWFAIGIFWVGMFVKGLTYSKTAIRMGIPFSLLWFPIVDFLYAVAVPLIGGRAVIVKNNRWK